MYTMSSTQMHNSYTCLNEGFSFLLQLFNCFACLFVCCAFSVFAAMPKMADLTLDVGDVPRLTSAARLSHTQPCQELLSPHTSTEDLLQLAESSVDEDGDVDVLEVSSPTSELPAVSTVILGVDLSTEEEEVEDDREIDVLGLQPE